MRNRRRATTTYTTWGSGRRRRRVGAALIGLCALLVVVAATSFYLPIESKSNQQARAGGEGSHQPASSAKEDEAAASAKKEKDKKFDVLLGKFRTDYRYSKSKARRYNLKTASKAVNGTVVDPGETFSMNDNIEGVDYKKAKVFAEGGETLADGGGLCQVTSTVYMAAQYAGLDIVERHPHYAVLPYIRPGLDATVWFGGQGVPELDMRFKNTTSGKILVKEWVDDKGLLRAEIWGQKDNGKEVKMHSEQDFRDLDRGLKWSTYKTVKKNGKVLRQGFLYDYTYSFPPSTGDPDKYNKVRVGGWSS